MGPQWTFWLIYRWFGLAGERVTELFTDLIVRVTLCIWELEGSIYMCINVGHVLHLGAFCNGGPCG
jgi:hypothetical protein